MKRKKKVKYKPPKFKKLEEYSKKEKEKIKSSDLNLKILKILESYK